MPPANQGDEKSRARFIIDALGNMNKDEIVASVDETDNISPDDIEVEETRNRIKRWYMNTVYAASAAVALVLFLAFAFLIFHFVKNAIIERREGEVLSDAITFIFGALASVVLQPLISWFQRSR